MGLRTERKTLDQVKVQLLGAKHVDSASEGLYCLCRIRAKLQPTVHEQEIRAASAAFLQIVDFGAKLSCRQEVMARTCRTWRAQRVLRAAQQCLDDRVFVPRLLAREPQGLITEPGLGGPISLSLRLFGNIDYRRIEPPNVSPEDCHLEGFAQVEPCVAVFSDVGVSFVEQSIDSSHTASHVASEKGVTRRAISSNRRAWVASEEMTHACNPKRLTVPTGVALSGLRCGQWPCQTERGTRLRLGEEAACEGQRGSVL